MQIARVYKEMIVTYGEVAEALKQLDFKDVSTKEQFRFVNEEAGSDWWLPARPLDTLYSKGNLFGISYQLYMQGIIDEIDDFAKLIEKNRLEAEENKALELFGQAA
jgi:hypothetical protein